MRTNNKKTKEYESSNNIYRNRLIGIQYNRLFTTTHIPFRRLRQQDGQGKQELCNQRHKSGQLHQAECSRQPRRDLHAEVRQTDSGSIHLGQHCRLTGYPCQGQYPLHRLQEERQRIL